MKNFILITMVMIVISLTVPAFSQSHLVTLDLIANENGNTPCITYLYQESHFCSWFLAPLTGKWIQLGAGIKKDFKDIKARWLFSTLFSSDNYQKSVKLEGVLPIIFITAEKGLFKLELQNRYYIEFPKEKISYDWLRSDVTFGKTLRLGARNELKVFKREDKKSGEKQASSRLGPMVKYSFSTKASSYLWFGWDIRDGLLKTITASVTFKF